MKYLKHIVTILAALTISSASMLLKLKWVKLDWDTGYFQAEIYKQALEKMGYKVRSNSNETTGILRSCCCRRCRFMGKGWFGTHDGYIAEAKGKVKAVGTVMEKGGLQGYLIDKKTADKFGIKSCIDIKKHAKQFDSNNDGKADMVSCPPGWGCEKVIAKHFDELG